MELIHNLTRFLISASIIMTVITVMFLPVNNQNLIVKETSVSYPDTSFKEQPKANGFIEIPEPEQIRLEDR